MGFLSICLRNEGFGNWPVLALNRGALVSNESGLIYRFSFTILCLATPRKRKQSLYGC